VVGPPVRRRRRAVPGFPFVVCAREHTKASIQRVAAERLEHTPEEEERVALEEIAKIARLRLQEMRFM
jgi:2-oxo-4-hydroxy-4-carboxy--5-ureidoimidazoline (OHCU) decarboxylase